MSVELPVLDAPYTASLTLPVTERDGTVTKMTFSSPPIVVAMAIKEMMQATAIATVTEQTSKRGASNGEGGLAKDDPLNMLTPKWAARLNADPRFEGIEWQEALLGTENYDRLLGLDIDGRMLDRIIQTMLMWVSVDDDAALKTWVGAPAPKVPAPAQPTDYKPKKQKKSGKKKRK